MTSWKEEHHPFGISVGTIGSLQWKDSRRQNHVPDCEESNISPLRISVNLFIHSLSIHVYSTFWLHSCLWLFFLIFSPLTPYIFLLLSLHSFPVFLFWFCFCLLTTEFNQGHSPGNGYESIHWRMTCSPVATSLKTMISFLLASLNCHSLLWEGWDNMNSSTIDDWMLWNVRHISPLKERRHSPCPWKPTYNALLLFQIQPDLQRLRNKECQRHCIDLFVYPVILIDNVHGS